MFFLLSFNLALSVQGRIAAMFILKRLLTLETIHEGMVKFIYCVYPFLSDFLLDYNEFRASKKYNESFEKE